MFRKESTAPACPAEKICCFCGWKEDNELDYGKFYECNGIVTHYYCLLFSSNMQQKGLDDEGILGFLPEDINKELKRGKRLYCSYCRKPGATLGCCNTKCKKMFHFPCGLKAGTLHQYFGEFRSFCINHRPKQKIDPNVLKEIANVETKICYICYDEVKPRDFLGTIWAPCCKKNAWFHRLCVQRLAMSAGYFFKCPLCNNKNEFQKAMLDHGIFIPSQDASWELVPNAFQELLYRHNRCDAEECVCPKGREHTSSNVKWGLTLCRTCGSQGIHMSCGNLRWGESTWECNECISILSRSLISGKYQRVNGDAMTDNDDEESSDSEISVGAYDETNDEPAEISNSDDSRSSRVFRETSKSPEEDPLGGVDEMLVELPKSRGVEEPENANDEFFSPLSKKPKIDETPISKSQDTESDDDIIIVSGPSNDKNYRLEDRNKNSWDFASSETSRVTNGHAEQQNFVEMSSNENASKVFSTSVFPPVQSNAEKPVVGDQEPIEIDLSDSESVTSSPATCIPELSIRITNVTSLAQEVFDSVPEAVQDPFVQNESEKLITDIRSCATEHFENEVHQKLQIVRLENNESKRTNTPMYGLTIPGTKNTVPLIISGGGVENSLTKKERYVETRSRDDPIIEFVNVTGPRWHKEALMAAAMEKQASLGNIQESLSISSQPTNFTLQSDQPSTRILANEDPVVPKKNETKSELAITVETVVKDQIFQLACGTTSRSKKKKNSSSGRSETKASTASSLTRNSINTTTESSTVSEICVRSVLSTPNEEAGQLISNYSVPLSQSLTANSSLPADRGTMISQNEYNLNTDLGRAWQVSPDHDARCAGDAGSSPADETMFHRRTRYGTERVNATGKDRLDTSSTDNNSTGSNNRRFINEYEADKFTEHFNNTHNSAECPFAVNRTDSVDRIGLMNKVVSLRDLKFTVCGSNVVKMTLYNSYYVHMNVRNGIKRKYKSEESGSLLKKDTAGVFEKRKSRPSLFRSNEGSKNVNNESEVLPSSTSNPLALSSIAESNEKVNASTDFQDVIPKQDSESTTNAFPRSEVNSQGRDELKENLDPVTPPTNQAIAPNVPERRYKTRRDGIKHTMQLFNEQESLDRVSSEKSNQSKTLSNAWNENCGASQTIPGSDTNWNSLANNSSNGNVARISKMHPGCVNLSETDDVSNQGKLAKRLKQGRCESSGENSKSDHVTSMSYLVSNVERIHSRNSPHFDMEMRDENINTDGRKNQRIGQRRGSNDASLRCCKVSIDLSKIRPVLNKKCIKLNDEKNGKHSECASPSHYVNKETNKDNLLAKKCHNGIKRSRSLENLISKDASFICHFCNYKSRKWKSSEDLRCLENDSKTEVRLKKYRRKSKRIEKERSGR